MNEILKSVPRNVWIGLGVILIIVAFGTYYWGKSSGLEECKRA